MGSNKKTKKFRGYRTHGRGTKSGRGGGIHGGRGNAGKHKHKYLHTVKFEPDYFGRYGFKRPQGVSQVKTTINLQDISRNIEHYTDKSAKDAMPVLNLKKFGFEKLLGKGELTKPVKILIPEASATAMEKVKEAGGQIETGAEAKK